MCAYNLPGFPIGVRRGPCSGRSVVLCDSFIVARYIYTPRRRSVGYRYIPPKITNYSVVVALAGDVHASPSLGAKSEIDRCLPVANVRRRAG